MQDNKVILQEVLEYRILHGLSCEWEAALGVLPGFYEGRMRKPQFALRDMKKRWGRWSSEKREISLSLNLVMKHSWDAVVDVLRHEMAHQLADEVLNNAGEPPHGPCFREACRLLRADPRASGDFAPLDERIRAGVKNSQDRIMVRVRKLMSLAQSRNQHEADLAMAKAHELVARYNIDLIRLNRERNFVSVFLGKPALRHFRESYKLAHLVQDFYQVYGIWVSAYVLPKGKMGRVLEISGTEKNVAIAGYVYDFVNHYIDTKWRAYNRDGRLSRYRKTDFAVGVIEGFYSKLESQKKKLKQENEMDLIEIEDPELSTYRRYRYPRVSRFRRSMPGHDKRVLEDGEKLGRRLVISKGIHEKGGNRGLLLE